MSKLTSGIVLAGAPFAWLHAVDESAKTIVETFTFDNLNDSSAKFPKASDSSSSSGDKTEVTRADNFIWQFPTTKRTGDAITETEIVTATSDSDATGKCEIVIATNQIPINAAFTTPTSFIAKLQSLRTSKFLITLAYGFTHDNLTDASKAKPSGYFVMFGKITSDLEFKNATSVSPISLTFGSYRITDSAVQTALSTALTATTPGPYTALTWNRGRGSSNPTGIKPPVLTTAQIATLFTGEPLVLESAA